MIQQSHLGVYIQKNSKQALALKEISAHLYSLQNYSQWSREKPAQKSITH